MSAAITGIFQRLKKPKAQRLILATDIISLLTATHKVTAEMRQGSSLPAVQGCLWHKAVHSSALHGSDPHRNRVSEQQPNQAAFPLRPQAPSLQNDSRSPSGPARYRVYNSCCKDPGILRERVPFFPCGRELRNMHKAHSIIGLTVSPVCSDHPA